MAFSIAITFLCISGIISGIKKKNIKLIILSSLAQAALIFVWFYLYTHPY